MKLSNPTTRIPGFLILAFLALTGFISTTNVRAADSEPTGSGGQVFATPDEAVGALQAAVATKDPAALQKVFGPGFKDLLTGDQVEDSNIAEKFASVMAEGCNQVKEGDNVITLELGTNQWPMPIPLVLSGGQWSFDTAAGKDEIINRHIGKDELYAIGVCRAYVTAQQQYASMNPTAGGGAKYAQKFKSTPGTKDGLYWPPDAGGPTSPFGPLVAEAHAAGYGQKLGTGVHPFYGYYFRILTRQGDAATGGSMNYLSHHELTAGFALVAFPEHWDQSGIMTFIVNQDGKVYQQNLGPKTSKIAGKLKEYNPDAGWTLVQDNGVPEAVSEK
jgi:hypothetical protein